MGNNGRSKYGRIENLVSGFCSAEVSQRKQQVSNLQKNLFIAEREEIYMEFLIGMINDLSVASIS